MSAIDTEQVCARQDLARTPSILWLWGIPLVIALAASVLNGIGALPLPAAGAVWTVATLWAGVGCLINARSCGRVHCRIDGIMFPALAFVGVLNVVGIVSVNWNVYWLAFFVVLGASFVPELVWKKYA